VVDDVPAETLSDDDAELRGFREGWHAERVAGHATLVGAFAAAGLPLERDEDLTSLVLLRSPRSLARRVRVNEAFHRLLAPTPLGTVTEALHGGLMLERLYERGVVRYRMMVGRKSG
jgi:hypothetical protein